MMHTVYLSTAFYSWFSIWVAFSTYLYVRIGKVESDAVTNADGLFIFTATVQHSRDTRGTKHQRFKY